MTEQQQPAYPSQCPVCSADLDGGPIPESVREHYAPPYRWSRAVQVKVLDGRDYWECPDCKWQWS